MPISDLAENAKCLKLPQFYQLLMFQCATPICGHFLFCTRCQFPNFPFLFLKIDLHSQLYFHHFYRIRPFAIMARLGEKLQNQIEPIIRDLIDCMEPGTPRVEIESYRREDSCQVFLCFKKSLRNTLCSRPDLKFHLKVMSDICDGFWMIFFYSGDFGILLKKKTLQIAFPTVYHLFWTRFTLQPT